MKLLKAISIVAAMLALVALSVTFFLESTAVEKADTYQRIERSAEADLFGDIGTKIGTPQKYVIEDPKAILEGTDEQGNKLLDENYLKANNIYPVQLKSIQSTASYAKIASISALILFTGLSIFSIRKLKSKSPDSTAIN